MKNTILFSTLIAGLALAGCNKSTKSSTAATDPTLTPTAPAPVDTSTTPAPADTLGAKVDRTGERVADASRAAADNVRDTTQATGAALQEASSSAYKHMTHMSDWRLSNADLEADLAAKRDIVRTKTSVGAPTGKIDDDTIEKAIKGSLHADAMLAGLKFDVNARKNGEVELEGKARTADQIGHAIGLALDTEGVSKVTSKIKLDPDAGSNRK